jgi:flagella basal body P-ring formation protein FlgA
VRAGQVVGDKDIEPAPAVSRGQRARLLSVAGSVTVESNVDVLQDGSPGQMVRVRLPGSAGVVTAKVRESGVVEMIQ